MQRIADGMDGMDGRLSAYRHFSCSKGFALVASGGSPGRLRPTDGFVLPCGASGGGFGETALPDCAVPNLFNLRNLRFFKSKI
jgi:hypothetical protein